MRNGYFIAQTGELKGDPEFAAQSKELFDSLGLNTEFSGHYYGASFCQKEDGTISRIICLRDFFREEFKVMVHMLPLLKPGDTTLN
jgi:hypothetical protein